MAVVLLIASIHSFAILVAMSVAVSLYIIRQMYCSASRQLKALQLDLDGKLYSEFAETVTGVALIQCLEMEELYLSHMQETIDDANSIGYHIKSLEAWMKMMTDAMTTIFISSFIYILTWSEIDPHLAGFTLFVASYAIQPLPDIIQRFNKLDMAMVGIQQIEEFIATMPQMPREEAKPALPEDWPKKGVIEFEKVTIGYK